MKFLLLLGMVMVLSTSLIISNTFTASAAISNQCTVSYPCKFKVCADHICAPGEFEQLSAQIIQSQKLSVSSNVTASQSSTTVVAKVMAYIDKASDGTTVLIRAAHPLSGQPLSLGIGFFSANTNAIKHQNYAITVKQDNVVVFSNPKGHTHTGLDTMTTFALPSSNPISIEVTLNGVGLPTADPSTWTGVKGEVLDFLQGPEDEIAATPVDTTVVPEFGPIASIVLAISVLSIVIVTKTRTIPKL